LLCYTLNEYKLMPGLKVQHDQLGVYVRIGSYLRLLLHEDVLRVPKHTRVTRILRADLLQMPSGELQLVRETNSEQAALVLMSIVRSTDYRPEANNILFRDTLHCYHNCRRCGQLNCVLVKLAAHQTAGYVTAEGYKPAVYFDGTAVQATVIN
jgi:hypothetical protein